MVVIALDIGGSKIAGALVTNKYKLLHVSRAKTPASGLKADVLSLIQKNIEHLLEKAAKINGVTDLVVNKMDILEKVNRWVSIENNMPVSYLDSSGFSTHIKNKLAASVNKFYFSESPHHI